MKQYLALILGVAAVVLGIIFLIPWQGLDTPYWRLGDEAWIVVKGSLVLFIFFAGVIALLMGAVQVREDRENKRREEEEKKRAEEQRAAAS